MPAIFRWSGQLPAGRVCDTPLMGMEVLPTRLAPAGIMADRSLDGVNRLPLATGTSTIAPREIRHGLLGANHAVRRGDWKYVPQNKPDLLFDLRARQPEEFAELHARHETWVKSLPPPLTEQARTAAAHKR